MLKPMSDTSARLLRLLSLLQVPRSWSGSELARRLEVTGRTVRRDVERLRELGYPVEGAVGVAGGYRLVAGTAMPPLLLEDDEAVAVAVGLRTATGQAITGIDEAAVRALTKLEAVLPRRLRRQVGSIGAATDLSPDPLDPPVDPAILTEVAMAITQRLRLHFGYRSGAGARSERRVEPHRLVVAQRRWYLLAFDLDRADWRVFRVDRVSGPRPTQAPIVQRPLPADDLVAYVTERLQEPVPVYRAVATLRLPADAAAARLGTGAGDFEPIDATGCRYRSRPDTLEWIVSRLLLLDCDFEVHEPPELITYLRRVAARVDRATPAEQDEAGLSAPRSSRRSSTPR